MDSRSAVFPQPFPEIFEEEDTSKILEAVLKKIDISFKKSDSVPKTIFFDFLGTQKAGKTKTTEKMEQVLRRHKFNLYCPPETAEIATVRNKISENPAVSQAIHLTGVQDYVLNLAHHPRYHAVIISRGLIDMLYWYERDRRKDVYSNTYCQAINNHIYELLRMDLVDSFILFTCSVEAAMKREYEEALTQKRGSKMNEKDVAETLSIYNRVIAEVEQNVPGLPIFRIDTSELSIRQVGQEALRFLLPIICQRFSVPISGFMPYSRGLLKKTAGATPYFEEQLKLKGHPSLDRIISAGFSGSGKLEQEDIYLGTGSDSEEIIRIREDAMGLRFMYKGPARERILSHRKPLCFDIERDDADNILKSYQIVQRIKKLRECFDNPALSSDGYYCTIHVDTIEGLGEFTEIRMRGSSDTTHTKQLLDLATQLGFGLSDVVEGSYLSLATKNRSS